MNCKNKQKNNKQMPNYALLVYGPTSHFSDDNSYEIIDFDSNKEEIVWCFINNHCKYDIINLNYNDNNPGTIVLVCDIYFAYLQ